MRTPLSVYVQELETLAECDSRAESVLGELRKLVAPRIKGLIALEYEDQHVPMQKWLDSDYGFRLDEENASFKWTMTIRDKKGKKSTTGPTGYGMTYSDAVGNASAWALRKIFQKEKPITEVSEKSITIDGQERKVQIVISKITRSQKNTAGNDRKYRSR